MMNWYKKIKYSYEIEDDIYEFFNIIFSSVDSIEKYAKIYDEEIKQKIRDIISEKELNPALVQEIIKKTKQSFKNISYFLFKEGYIYRDSKKIVERYIRKYKKQPSGAMIAKKLGVDKFHVYAVYKKLIEQGLINPESFVSSKISQDVVDTIYKVYDWFKASGNQFTVKDIGREVERITGKRLGRSSIDRYLAYVKKQTPRARLDATLHKFVQKFYVATGVGFPTALSRIPDNQKMIWISSMIDKLLNDSSELQENTDLKKFFMEKTQIRDYMSQKAQEAIEQNKTMRNVDYSPEFTGTHPSYFAADR